MKCDVSDDQMAVFPVDLRLRKTPADLLILVEKEYWL